MTEREWLVILKQGLEDFKKTTDDYFNDLITQIEIQIEETDERQIDRELGQEELGQ